MSQTPPSKSPPKPRRTNVVNSRRNCRKKQAYPTRARARLSLRNHPARLAKHLCAYHCPNCNKYHLGNPKKGLTQILDSLASQAPTKATG